ncbi:MAG: hypothetical protein KBD67_04055 [Anaerolineaceae bacterium]|nr:hypothetical protein [Anaerolineaceae bacterium]
MLDSYPKPMIFAHRGASKYAPENTVEAFQLAANHGTEAIELDVKLTVDNQAVVIHDKTVDRTTDGIGQVNQLTLAEIKKLNAANHFENYQGVKVPTLDEVFESVGKLLFINVELTNYSSSHDNLIPIVANIVKRHGVQQSILFSSFIPANLRKMKTLLPEVPVGLLAQSGFRGALSRSSIFLGLSPQIIHPNLEDVNEKMMATEHKRGRRVHVWTVNEEADIKRLLGLGVDGIFTDDPLNTLKILGRK